MNQANLDGVTPSTFRIGKSGITVRLQLGSGTRRLQPDKNLIVDNTSSLLSIGECAEIEGSLQLDGIWIIEP
mgnify:CR=1 FL=1